MDILNVKADLGNKGETMGKVKEFFTNELLLDRENNIRNLKHECKGLRLTVSKLRLTLLKVRTMINIKTDNNDIRKVIKSALNDD